MANYTVNIDGVDYPVVNRPWEMSGIYSDEMNLQTMAVLMARSPSNAALRRGYDALLQRKLDSVNEIADIKDRIKRAKERFARVYPPGFREERLAALKDEQAAEFDRNDVGGKKRKKMSNKISNKRKKHSRRRRRRTHSRSKY